MKIVINACFGGFGLSEAGMRAYARRKGLSLWVEYDKYKFPHYWLVPPEKRPASQDDWPKWTTEERQASNAAHSAASLYDRDIKRDDPDLVTVVEELGEAANGQHGELRVVEIPDGVAWEIDEYDGNETIDEVHRSWR